MILVIVEYPASSVSFIRRFVLQKTTRMSFLVSDADHFDTLGEVLAFIDSCEIDTSFDVDDGDILFHSIRGGNVSPTDVGMTQHKTFTGKKRKRRNLSSSTRLQQCKKAEILFLRKQVLELEEQMKLLQRASKRLRLILPQREPNLDQSRLEVKSRWEQLAEDCYQARLRSEEKNRSLKAIMANQVQMSKTLCTIMHKQVVHQGTALNYQHLVTY